MFMKGGNSIVLKKSGEIMANTQPLSLKKDVIGSLGNNTRLRLDSFLLNTSNINYIDRSGYAQYNKINHNKLFYVENMDCINYRYKLSERCSFVKDFCINRYKEGLYNETFMRDYLICTTSIQRAVKSHTVVTEVIDQTEDSITFSYYVITTQKKIVNYGGGNKFKPLLLYNDIESGKNFFTIPLLLIDRVPKTEFEYLFLLKKEEDYRDNYELQKKLVNNIMKLEKDEKILFKQLHVKDDFLEKDMRNINFSTLFKNKDPKYVTKSWEEFVFN